MMDILVHELGGTSIDYTARVSESPWAAVHFTIRLPDQARQHAVDTSQQNRQRIQSLLSEAARTWADRLLGAVRFGSIGQEQAEHYAEAFPEVYKQAVPPDDAIAHIGIIEELQDDSVKLVFARGRQRGAHRAADVVPRRPVGVPEPAAADAAEHGRHRARGAPFTVTRADGLQVWIYQFKIALHPTIPNRRRTATRRDCAAVRRRRHRDLARAGRDGPVQRTGAACRDDLAAGRDPARVREISSPGGFPVQPGAHRSGGERNPQTARSLVALFQALFDPSDSTERDAQAAAAAVAKDIEALVSLDTDRVMRAFASLVQGTLRTNYFVTRDGSARRRACCR